MTDQTERLERGRAQLLEAMSAVSEDRTCCGWAADWARTLHAEGGIWETLGRAVGWPTGNYDAWWWVSWDEAAALYGHAISSAGQAPTTDQTALRDAIAEALMRWAERNNNPQYAPMRRSETVKANAYSRADAVLAVLPAPADQATAPAAECSAQNRNYESGPRLCIRAAQHHGDHIDERGFHWSDTVAVYPVADGTFRTGSNVRAALRRLADEAAVPGRTGDETEHVCAPGATTYFCPTSGETESDCHGGFVQCCDRPELHRPAVGGAQQPKEA
jgi:hypothetical protein